MARQIIKRMPDGRLEKRPDDIDEFAKEVVKNLCNKYPDIDFFDLKYCFETSFNFEFTCRMAEESVEK